MPDAPMNDQFLHYVEMAAHRAAARAMSPPSLRAQDLEAARAEHDRQMREFLAVVNPSITNCTPGQFFVVDEAKLTNTWNKHPTAEAIDTIEELVAIIEEAHGSIEPLPQVAKAKALLGSLRSFYGR